MGETPLPLNGINGNQTPRQLAAEDGSVPSSAPRINVSGNLRPAKVEEVLATHITDGYKPNLPIYTFRDEYWNGPMFYMDIEAMLLSDSICTPLEYVMAPLSQMQITCKGSSTRVVTFLIDEWTKFKEKWLAIVQLDSYPYGWMGAECIYAVEHGKLVLDEFCDFAPRDVEPRVRGNTIVDLQVSNMGVSTGHYLPSSNKGFPTKGFWYPHRPRNGRNYGRSQIQGAWRPWRRLTGRDGLEEVMDIAVHRYGAGNVIVRAPIGDVKASNQPSGPSRQSMLERAREMAELIKAGGGIAMPSDTDANGKPKWDIDVFQPQMNLTELISGAEYLETKCSKGIGFPPELLEAAETGSGFSGRMIPLQGFLMTQDSAAKGIFHCWLKQIGEPLVRWNFGERAQVKCTVVPLLTSYRKASQGMTPQSPPPQMPQAAPPQQAPQGPAQATSDDAPAVAPDANGHLPYHGPRGGKGYRDAQGRIHYTAMLSTTTSSEAMATAAESIDAFMDGLTDPDQSLRQLARALPDLEPNELDELANAIEQAERQNAPAVPVVPALTAQDVRREVNAIVDRLPKPAPSVSVEDVRREARSALSDVVGPLRDQMVMLSTRPYEPTPVQQPAPVINVTTPDVHFTAPAVNVAPASVHLSTQLPEQAMRHVVDAIDAVKASQVDAECRHGIEMLEMSEQQELASSATVSAIEKLCQQLANMPAPVVHTAPPIVHVAPPLVNVVVPPAGAMEITPTYDADGRVTKVVKTPVGPVGEPAVEIVEASVEIEESE